MQVECFFYGPFRDDVGRKAVVWETDAETYGELLTELESAFPALRGRLLATDGDEAKIAGETAITKNTRNIRHLDGLETPVEDGDELRMTPAVYGGCDAP